MSKKDVQKLYIDYFNNFLTLEKFAEHYNISIEKAKKIIEIGCKIQDRYCFYKSIDKYSKIQLVIEFIDFLDMSIVNNRQAYFKIKNKTLNLNEFIKIALYALKDEMTADSYFTNLHKELKKRFKTNDFYQLCNLFKKQIQKRFQNNDCTIL